MVAQSHKNKKGILVVSNYLFLVQLAKTLFRHGAYQFSIGGLKPLG
jgi:hypothetical protein